MTKRTYTVRELDALRKEVERKWSIDFCRAYEGYCGSPSLLPDKTKAVEELVRTHMLAGHTAEDLIASERQDPPPPPPDQTAMLNG